MEQIVGDKIFSTLIGYLDDVNFQLYHRGTSGEALRLIQLHERMWPKIQR